MLLPDTLPDVTVELASLRDGLARLAAIAQQPTEPHSSIEIARNTKGVTWVVKVYASSADTAWAEAQRLYDELAARFGDQPEA